MAAVRAPAAAGPPALCAGGSASASNLRALSAKKTSSQSRADQAARSSGAAPALADPSGFLEDPSSEAGNAPVDDFSGYV